MVQATAAAGLEPLVWDGQQPPEVLKDWASRCSLGVTAADDLGVSDAVRGPQRFLCRQFEVVFDVEALARVACGMDRPRRESQELALLVLRRHAVGRLEPVVDRGSLLATIRRCAKKLHENAVRDAPSTIFLKRLRGITSA